MIELRHILTAKNSFYATLMAMAVIFSLLAPKVAVNVAEQLLYPHAKFDLCDIFGFEYYKKMN